MNGLGHPTFKPASHVADEFMGEHVPGSQIYAMHFPVSIVSKKSEADGYSESLNSEWKLESET
jgi:hypothetical protein